MKPTENERTFLQRRYDECIRASGTANNLSIQLIYTDFARRYRSMLDALDEPRQRSTVPKAQRRRNQGLTQ